MFQRCAGVRTDANGCIAVPLTPTEIFRNIIPGLAADMKAASPMAGGFGLRPAAAGPSPIPRGP
jgi:hypothetical protein